MQWGIGREVGEGERKQKGTQREKRKKKERGRPKCLEYIGKRLWEKGSPAPRLQSSRFGIGYAK